MATHGSIGEFRRNAEEWTPYIEQLECYFTANDITKADKMCAIILTCHCSSTYSLICSLAAASKPMKVRYEDIINQVTSNFNSRLAQVLVT